MPGDLAQFRLMRYLSILTLILLVGCSNTSEVNPILATPSAVMDEQVVTFHVADILVQIHRPPDWEYYTTEHGIVLAESVAGDGQLDGLLTHIFIPPLDGFSVNVSEENNHALTILRQVIQHKSYIGDAVISEPIPFQWQEMDAAYYLMDNGEGNLTIVMGVVPLNSDHLVVVSVSAPEDQAARIRYEVPLMLAEFQVNNLMLEGDDLEAVLPDPLTFPHYE